MSRLIATTQTFSKIESIKSFNKKPIIAAGIKATNNL